MRMRDGDPPAETPAQTDPNAMSKPRHRPVGTGIKLSRDPSRPSSRATPESAAAHANPPATAIQSAVTASRVAPASSIDWAATRDSRGVGDCTAVGDGTAIVDCSNAVVGPGVGAWLGPQPAIDPATTTTTAKRKWRN